MATLTELLNAISGKQNFLEYVEITDLTRNGSKLKQYEFYFGKPDSDTITVEYLQIYVNGDEARIVAPCFLCGESKTFRLSIQSTLEEMAQDADKVRILFIDETEKYAIVEKVIYNSSDGTAATKVFKVYELPDRSIRVVES